MKYRIEVTFQGTRLEPRVVVKDGFGFSLFGPASLAAFHGWTSRQPHRKALDFAMSQSAGLVEAWIEGRLPVEIPDQEPRLMIEIDTDADPHDPDQEALKVHLGDLDASGRLSYRLAMRPLRD